MTPGVPVPASIVPETASDWLWSWARSHWGRHVVIRAAEAPTIEHTWDGRPEIVGPDAATTIEVLVRTDEPSPLSDAARSHLGGTV